MTSMHISDQKNIFYDIFSKLKFLKYRQLLRFISKYLHELWTKTLPLNWDKHSQTTTEYFPRLEENVKISHNDNFYVLYIFRLANQEKVRAKKDEKIHDMAMEQKKKMEEAKKSGQRFKAFLFWRHISVFQGFQIIREVPEDLWVSIDSQVENLFKFSISN